MSSIDYMAQHHKAKLDRVEHYLRFNNVASDLKAKILSYYKYISLNSQSSEDFADFTDLPEQLQLQLSIALNREFIVKCPVFAHFYNESILRVLRCLRPLPVVHEPAEPLGTADTHPVQEERPSPEAGGGDDAVTMTRV